MTAKSYYKGHEIYYDYDKKEWLYMDNNTSILTERPCKKCGKQSLLQGEDYCIGNLGEKVKSACCGHGVEKGYILFKDGRRFDEK